MNEKGWQKRVTNKNLSSELNVIQTKSGLNFFNHDKYNIFVELFDVKGAIVLKTEIPFHSNYLYNTKTKGTFAVRINRNSSQSFKILCK